MRGLRILLFAIASLPGVLFAIPPLLVWLIWGENLHMDVKRMAVVFSLKPASWPMRTWYRKWGGTTFGHVIMTRPEVSKGLLDHEAVHVEQFDGNALLCLALGIAVVVSGRSWVGLAIWGLGPWAQYISAGIVAVLRGESFYRGNANEESAYSQTREGSHDGK